MALPAGMTTFTVTFGVAGVLGIDEPLGMNVTATASTSAIWAATGQPFLRKPQTATAPVGQSGSMTLINPDQTGFINSLGQQVRNWTIAFDIEYVDAAGKSISKASKNLAYLTTMGSPIDLDLTIPVSTSAGVVVNIPATGFVLPPGGQNGQALGLVNGQLGWITVTGGGTTPAPSNQVGSALVGTALAA
jgi:hypothetical protein